MLNYEFASILTGTMLHPVFAGPVGLKIKKTTANGPTGQPGVFFYVPVNKYGKIVAWTQTVETLKMTSGKFDVTVSCND